jgi:hypothetical protein
MTTNRLSVNDRPYIRFHIRPRVSLRMLFVFIAAVCILTYVASDLLFVCEQVGCSWQQFVFTDSRQSLQATEEWLGSQGYHPSADRPRFTSGIIATDGKPLNYKFFEATFPSGRRNYVGITSRTAEGGTWIDVAIGNEWKAVRWSSSSLKEDREIAVEFSSLMQAWMKSHGESTFREYVQKRALHTSTLD